MNFPTSKELQNAILDALKALGGSGTVEEIEAKVIEQLKLPEEMTKAVHTSTSGLKRNELTERLFREFQTLQRLGVAERLWALKAVAQVDPSAAFPIPDCSPFPPSSDFAKIFAILYAHRDNGISRPALLLCYRQWTLKDKDPADYDLSQALSVCIAKGWIVERDGRITMITAAVGSQGGVADAEQDLPTATARPRRSSPTAATEYEVITPPIQNVARARR